MSKSVMLSIQPKRCELIASGQTTIEVRKTKPKIDVPFKCYIYCTYGNALTDLSNCQSMSIEDEVKKGIIRRYALQEHKINGQIHSTCAYGNGKVIGSFVCNKICNLVQFGGGIAFADENLKQLEPQLFRGMSCLTDEKTESYLDGKDGYAWHISDLVIYDKPKELSEFYSGKVCKDYWGGNSGCDDVCGIAENNQCRGGHTALRNPPQSWGYVEEIK